MADGFLRHPVADPAPPVEVAFLARHGVAPSALLAAMRQAARLGVDPAHHLLMAGHIDETAFYRAFASEMRLAFSPECPRLRAGGVIGAIQREGVAPVEGAADPRFMLAPVGPALRRMLETGPRGRADIAVTTPRALGAALRGANGRSLARLAAGLDPIGLERQSARTGSSRGQRVLAGLGVGAAAFWGTLSPFETFFALAILAGPIFMAITLLRLAAVFEPQTPDLWRAWRWRVDDGRLPVYTVAVPLLREQAVLEQLLGALSELDYPPAKLDIRLLVEEHDLGMREALARRGVPAHMEVVVVPAGAPRTKPRALNLALFEARGEYLTIYDAEDVPDPQQLRQAAARFLRAPADLACLQARLVIDNTRDGWLPSLFALEYAGLFDVVNPGMLRCGLPIMLGGTSNHFRVAALRGVGGWDAWNVTEDADLGLRLVRAGYRIGDLPSRTLEEAPVTLPAWFAQRRRWIKGYVQTLICHLQRPDRLLREAGLAATLAFLALALGGVVSALGYPIFAVATIAAWIDGRFATAPGELAGLIPALAVTLWIAGMAAILLPPALGALRRGAPGLLLYLPLLPLYYALVSVAAWLALLEYVTRRFEWNKTAHGLARTSRYRDRPG